MNRVVLLVLTVACCPIAHAGIDGSVFLFPIETSFRSSGEAMWVDPLRRIDTSVELEGTHGVYGPVIFESPFSVTGRYAYDLEGPADPGACYGTSLQVEAHIHLVGNPEETFNGDTRCAPPPVIPPPPKEPTPGSEIDVPYEGHTPIVIALHARYDFTDVEGGVQFDIDADGEPDRVAWPRDGSVAFLFHDRNGNGVPDDGGELFGDHTRLRNGSNARHGFEALAEFDSNGDGTVSAADAQWAQLGLWQDHDHDGVATSGEIRTLTAAGISELGLGYHWTGRRDARGNILRWQANVARADAARRPYYDVCLLTR